MSCGFFVEFNSHAGRVPHRDESVLNDGVWQPFDYIIPPFGISDRILKSDIILG